MAAKSWDADFRYPAIQASMRLVSDGYLDDPFQCPNSFCIPVAEQPAIGWTPGKIMLIVALVGFAGIGAGAWLGAIADKNPLAQTRLLILGIICTLSGLAVIFSLLIIDRPIVSWLIGDRGRRLIERAGATPILVSEVSNADPARIKISIDGDDFVLIYPDEVNRRVLMEGSAARYQIRAEDVLQLLPFAIVNYVGVEITCRIGDDARLHIAVVRVSLLAEIINQLPFLFFLRKWISNRLYQRFSEVLTPQFD